MTIKLTPEHVGTRVLLSDGFPALIASYENGKFFICWASSAADFEQDDKGLFTEDTVVGGKAYLHAELLLDAPNSLDVEVPQWCRWVIGWRVFDAAPPHLIPAIHGPADFPHDVFGWSPAPGQMPPRVGVA